MVEGREEGRRKEGSEGWWKGERDEERKEARDG